MKSGLRILRQLAYLVRYVAPSNDEIRSHMAPSTPRLLLGERRWTAMRKWEWPRLDVAVMDGMGEHYGYPRHRANLILWWNRRGYAWGVEYTVTKPKHGTKD